MDALFRKGSYSIVRCKACSLVYSHEVPTPAELEKIYSESFFMVGEKFTGESKSPSFVNARQRVKELLSLPGLGTNRWLDVGCATGEFVLAAEPYVAEVKGVEMSPYAAERARARGIGNVTQGDFLEVDLDPRGFDVVCMWDFIEHVPDPAANLRKAFDILNTGGHLVLTTGDVESVVARLMGRYWHLMIPPRHLYFFSPETMGRMLKKAGFGSVSITRPGKRVPLDFAAWKLTNLLLPAVSPVALRLSRSLRLGRIAPFVNLFDIMTIHARKTGDHG